MPHKALNLARLPIPPPPRGRGQYRRRLFPSEPLVSYEHTFVEQSSPAEQGAAGMDLTKRQQEIFDFIKRYAAEHGYPPTVRDIGKAVGLASSSTVHAHLANLERLGMLRRDPSKPRAIELLDRAVGSVTGSIKTALGGANGWPLGG